MRVIQWATGAVGRTTLRRVIDDPDLELVGIYVRDPKKAGLDAGVIAKRPPTGVLATNDIEAILALEADAVIHVPLISVPYEDQNADVIRLLASGKNVLSTNGFYKPDIHGEAYAGPLRAAALKGNATLAGVGMNPGFIAERMALMLTGLMSKLQHIHCHEFFDAALSPSWPLLTEAMGFAAPLDANIAKGPIGQMYDGYYAETLHMMAERVGTRVVDIRSDHEITAAPEDLVLAAGVVPKGTVAATLWRWNGRFENGITMTHSILWTASSALHDESDTAHWVVEIKGRPNVRATLELTDPDPGAPRSRPAIDATAAVLIGAIRDVVAAPPGFYALPEVLPFAGLN